MLNRIINMILIITLLVSSFVLLSSDVHAINMMGGKPVVKYDPGSVEEISYTITNVNDLQIYVEGDFVESFNVKDVEINEDGNWYVDCNDFCTITMQLTIPSFDSPGWKESKITFKDSPPDLYGQSMMAATAAVRGPVKMMVPYPGKYLEVDFDEVQGTEKNVMSGDKKYFTVNAKSYGEEYINLVSGNVTISDSQDFSSDNSWTVKLTEINGLSKDQTSNMYAEWNTEGIDIGRYYAYANVSYDGNYTGDNYYFNVGSEYVEIEKIDPTELITGGINKIGLSYFNHWASDLEVYSYVSLKDKNSSEELSYVTTSTLSVIGQGYGSITGYLDLMDVPIGEYKLDIETFYSGSSNVQSFNVTVVEGVIEEIVEEVIEEEPVGINMYLLYGTIIFVTMLTLAALIFLFMKSRGGNEEDEFGDFDDSDFGGSSGSSDF